MSENKYRYQWFRPAPESFDEAKKQYHKLAFDNHPDRGGSLENMQAINAEYARVLTDLSRADARARQQAAHAEGRTSAADYHDIDDIADALRVKIEAALNISPDLIVELMGLWIWVTGDTKPHASELGAAGFKWAAKKCAWYFAGVPARNKRPIPLNHIRDIYGSVQFARADDDKEPAREPEYAARPGLHA